MENISDSTDLTELTPDYLHEVYDWAYLNPVWVPVLSASPVVEAILFGNANRLTRWCTDELEPHHTVLQVANVYGGYLKKVFKCIENKGAMTLIDVAPIQLEMAKKRLNSTDQVQLIRQDAREPVDGHFDRILCYFLLHEVPEEAKQQIVDALLEKLNKDEKLIFVDYHRPSNWHPLKPLISLVFRYLEPFAKRLWSRQIWEYASSPQQFIWRKQTCFGGMYQKVEVTKA